MRAEKRCPVCEGALPSQRNKYCSKDCQIEQRKRIAREKYELIKATPGVCWSCFRDDKEMHTHNRCTPCEQKRRENQLAYNLSAKYSLTVEEYELLLEAQGGGCAVCGKVANKNGRRLAVDHDHATMEVRGILCTYCNLRIVAKVKNSELLYKAAEYLDHPPATEFFGEPRLAKPAANRRRKRQPRKRPRKNG